MILCLLLTPINNTTLNLKSEGIIVKLLGDLVQKETEGKIFDVYRSEEKINEKFLLSLENYSK